MLHHDDRISLIAEPLEEGQESIDVARMEPD